MHSLRNLFSNQFPARTERSKLQSEFPILASQLWRSGAPLFRIVPFRLRRVQHVDFRQDYARGVQELLKPLALVQETAQSRSAISHAGSQSKVPDADERQRSAEQARLEDERRKAAELTGLEEERKQAAEQTRVEDERKLAAEEARLEDESRKTTEHAEGTTRENEQAEQGTQKRLLNIGGIGALPIGTGAIILIIAVAWLVFHFLSSATQEPDSSVTPATGHWNLRTSGTHESLRSIFGTSDGKRLWVVGWQGTILESDDGGQHWNWHAAAGVTKDLDFQSIFGTSDGNQLSGGQSAS